jgi:hypothetical protein
MEAERRRVSFLQGTLDASVERSWRVFSDSVRSRDLDILRKPLSDVDFAIALDYINNGI